MNILTISGSQRKESLNTALVKALPALAPEHQFSMLDYSDIPLYNQDMEAAFPQSVTTAKDAIRAADAIIVSTPEYNRSIPAPLKNLVDWTSRPYGDSAWNEKSVMVIGASGSPIGTALAQADLRKTLLYVGAYVPGQPEVYINEAHKKFNESGELTDEPTKEFLQRALAAFVEFAA